MSFLKGLTGRYQKYIGTSENHRDESLRTRYYKANFSQVFQTAEEILKGDSSCKVKSVSKEHGEISAETTRNGPAFLTVTVVTVKPFETAVDLHISTDAFSLSGVNPALKKEVTHFYEKLDKSHPFIGAGIHGNR